MCIRDSIGFDAGGSDRKVSAVIDGEPVYSEEVVWFPKVIADPDYHYQGILAAMHTAAAKILEKGRKVEGIGVSSAGVYIGNKCMVASLFLKVGKEDFDKKVKNIYTRAAEELGRTLGYEIPVVVANDGDVSALAGAMGLGENGIMGIAMGTSEAVGYVDGDGNICGWLNELAFAPVDGQPDVYKRQAPALRELYRRERPSVPVHMRLTLEAGGAALEARDEQGRTACAQVQAAHAPAQKDLTESCARVLEKTGGTPFSVRTAAVQGADAWYAPAGEIGALRREARCV